MSDQLPLPLPHNAAMGRSDFFAAGCNEMALALIDTWPSWPDRRLALVGPEGSGKSHLARIWAEMSNAAIVPAASLLEQDVPALAQSSVVLDDMDTGLDAPTERAAFHLYNLLGAEGHGLLVTGRRAPFHWPIALPDLASRLHSLTVAAVEAPDDAVLSALIVKHFADRQITVTPSVVSYVIPRIERSFAAVKHVAGALDKAAMARKSGITRPLAREVLDSLYPEA